MVVRRHGGPKARYEAERCWLEDLQRYRAILDVSLKAAEDEQDRATRITSAWDGIGGGRSGRKSDKVGESVANYDAVLARLKDAVRQYAQAMADRMEAIDSMSWPESRAACWRQFVYGDSMAQMVARFGVTRGTILRWTNKGLEEMHNAGIVQKKTKKTGA